MWTRFCACCLLLPLLLWTQSAPLADRAATDALFNTGWHLYQQQDFRGAQRQWQQALVGYARLKLEKDAADALTCLGVVAGDLSEYAAALQYLEQALEVYGRLKLETESARALNNLGTANRALGNYAEAREYYEQALGVYARLKLSKEAAYALNNLGIVAGAVGEYPAARRYYEQALEVFRQLKLEKEAAYALNNLGVVARALGEYAAARAYHQQSFTVYVRLNLAKEAAGALIGLGNVADDLGEYATARQHFQQALDLYDRLKMEKEAAYALQNVANVAVAMGEYAAARRYHERTLDIYRRLKLGKEAADALHNLGGDAHAVGDYGVARKYFEQALEMVRRLKLDREAADALTSLGMVAREGSEYAVARRYFEEARELYRRLGLSPGLRASSCDIGVIELKIGKPMAAMKIFQEYDCGEARLGHAHLALGETAAARERFASGLRWARGARDADNSIANLGGLGLAAEREGELEAARNHFWEAVVSMETQRERLPIAERRHFLGGATLGFARLEAYEGLVRVLQKLKRPSEAFHHSEYTRARGLMESVSRAASGTGQIPSDLRLRERELANRIAATRMQIDKAWQSKNVELEQGLEKQLAELRRQQQELIARLRGEYPEYAAMSYPQPLRAEELALASNEVLLAYEVTEPATLLFVVRTGRVDKVVEVKKTRRELQQMLQGFRRVFEEVARTSDVARLSKLDLRLGHQLYELLLKDALAGVKPEEKVLVVPDEFLSLLPFEALVERLPEGEVEWAEGPAGLYPKGVEYVGDHRVLSYWQSASSLTLLRQLRKPVVGERLLAVADPVFDANDPRLKARPRQAVRQARDPFQLQMMKEITNATLSHVGWKNFPRLEGTGEMVKQLRASHGQRLKTLEGLEASEATVKREDLGQYGLGVIFAVHGILDDRVPYLQQAALVLSNPELTGEVVDENNDGFLTMAELMGLRMPTEMVMALACNTGVGGELAGEGVMHLGRAFQDAGARSVLMSLWSVDETSTVKLAERLLAGIREGKTKDESLLTARRSLREGGFEHPFFWSGFILVGERGLLKNQ